jgi:hypothetical protein
MQSDYEKDQGIARAALKQIVDTNPSKSEADHQQLFHEACAHNKTLNDAVTRSVFYDVVKLREWITDPAAAARRPGAVQPSEIDLARARRDIRR